MKLSSSPRFIKSADDFQQWLEEHQANATELWIGFYKTNSGKEGMTYKEALDLALCYGWIDAVRKGIDEISYTIRFTPRKNTSIWSNVNIKRIEELIKLKMVKPSGLEAYKKRKESKSGIYSYEQTSHELSKPFEKQFKANKKAWKFFQEQAPWYKRTCMHWVMRAKREETRIKRLAQLMESSGYETRLGQFTSK